MTVALRITLQDSEIRQLSVRLAQFGDQAVNDALAELGESVRTMAIDSFESSTSPEGTAWQPSERALLTGGKTLIDTGDLQNSISVNMGFGEVEVGSNMVYAAIHQLGGKAGRNKSVTLPARPFLPEVEGNLLQREAMEVFQAHLKRALS